MGYIKHTILPLHSSWIIQILGLKSVSSILANSNTQHFQSLFKFQRNPLPINFMDQEVRRNDGEKLLRV